MAENSAIEWCTHTFNPWIGCQAVSPACAHCYARRLVNRWGADFDGVRRVTSDANWKKPLTWQRRREAELHLQLGTHQPVGNGIPAIFCGSLCDAFEDRPELVEPRKRLWQLIADTEDLCWLLLTKRPENIQGMLPSTRFLQDACCGIGVTVESNDYLWRVEYLLRTPAALHFVSVEPMLGELDLQPALEDASACLALEDGGNNRLDWVIIGGESGPGARPTEDRWIRSLVEQCKGANVPVFVKQRTCNGKKIPFEQWPTDLQVREMPEKAR